MHSTTLTMSVKRTKNSNLQSQLDAWVAALIEISGIAMQSPERLAACVQFCRTFVAPDVEEDDVQYFANNVATDEEFFESLVRDLSICAAGDRVESIGGNQKKKAVFTLRPIEDSEYDIVREVAFISSDNGTTWRAEG